MWYTLGPRVQTSRKFGKCRLGSKLIGSKKTDIYEGSLIRAFRLLVEVLRQMVQAAKAIGNTELENKFAAAITAIKLDIDFAPSLVGISWLQELMSSICKGVHDLCVELGSSIRSA